MTTSWIPEKAYHWRAWLNAGSISICICVLIVLLGSLVPRTAFGFSTSPILQSTAESTFYASIISFFVALASLARKQGREAD